MTNPVVMVPDEIDFAAAAVIKMADGQRPSWKVLRAQAKQVSLKLNAPLLGRLDDRVTIETGEIVRHALAPKIVEGCAEAIDPASKRTARHRFAHLVDDRVQVDAFTQALVLLGVNGVDIRALP